VNFRRLTLALAALGLALSSAACNIFSPFDHATSDTQLVSAARACFDKGDFACATKAYQQIVAEGSSDADYNIAQSESAFAVIDPLGASMGNFLAAFGSGGGGNSNGGSGGGGGGGTGSALTSLATSILGVGTGQSVREAIVLQALQNVNNISDTQLRGMVRFVTSAALISEVLAETASAAGATAFTAANLVNTPSACSTTPTTCGSGSACQPPAGSPLAAAQGAAPTVALESMTQAQLDATGPMWIINSAFAEIQTAASELGAGSGLGGSANNSAGDVTAESVAIGTNSGGCFLAALLGEGVGSN
jgi:hypothetical protein